MDIFYDHRGTPTRPGGFVTLVKSLPLNKTQSIQAGSRLGPVKIDREGVLFVDSFQGQDIFFRDKVILPQDSVENITLPAKIINEDNLFMTAPSLSVEEKEACYLLNRRFGDDVKFEAFIETARVPKINGRGFSVYIYQFRVAEIQMEIIDRTFDENWTLLKIFGQKSKI